MRECAYLQRTIQDVHSAAANGRAAEFHGHVHSAVGAVGLPWDLRQANLIFLRRGVFRHNMPLKEDHMYSTSAAP